MCQDNELVPYPEKVMTNFRARMAQQDQLRHPGEEPAPDSIRGRGPGSLRPFTDEQRWWLEKMAEHIASNLGLEAEDFTCAPFDQRGGL